MRGCHDGMFMYMYLCTYINKKRTTHIPTCIYTVTITIIKTYIIANMKTFYFGKNCSWKKLAEYRVRETEIYYVQYSFSNYTQFKGVLTLDESSLRNLTNCGQSIWVCVPDLPPFPLTGSSNPSPSPPLLLSLPVLSLFPTWRLTRTKCYH